MKLYDLLCKLQEFAQTHGNLEVSITDGFQAHVYQGEFEINHFNEVDGQDFCDIGIGGKNITPM